MHQSPQRAAWLKFAKRYGGEADLSGLTDDPGATWLVDVIKGLGTLADSYQGDKNQRGETYRVEHGIFDSMEINGAAGRVAGALVFGISFGTILRLMNAQMVLLGPPPDERVAKTLDYLLSAAPDDTEPNGISSVLSVPLTPSSRVQMQDRTFFSIGFVFLHEAVHTLIGHADFASQRLNLSLDELSLERESGTWSELIQAIELEADSAAFSNLWLTLKQSPRFGFCADQAPDPVDRIAEATIAGMTALLAIEGRRLKLNQDKEYHHPFPSRRISSILRLLSTYEQRGLLPKGVREAVAEKAKHQRPFFQDTPLARLVDVISGKTNHRPEDIARLSELIELYKSKLTQFEEMSYAPRVRLAAVERS